LNSPCRSPSCCALAAVEPQQRPSAPRLAAVARTTEIVDSQLKLSVIPATTTWRPGRAGYCPIRKASMLTVPAAFQWLLSIAEPQEPRTARHSLAAAFYARAALGAVRSDRGRQQGSKKRRRGCGRWFQAFERALGLDCQPSRETGCRGTIGRCCPMARQDLPESGPASCTHFSVLPYSFLIRYGHLHETPRRSSAAAFGKGPPYFSSG
jgi:hypothetical protein